MWLLFEAQSTRFPIGEPGAAHLFKFCFPFCRFRCCNGSIDCIEMQHLTISIHLFLDCLRAFFAGTISKLRHNNISEHGNVMKCHANKTHQLSSLNWVIFHFFASPQDVPANTTAKVHQCPRPPCKAPFDTRSWNSPSVVCSMTQHKNITALTPLPTCLSYFSNTQGQCNLRKPKIQ